jgi:hypothetical protein
MKGGQGPQSLLKTYIKTKLSHIFKVKDVKEKREKVKKRQKES